MVDKRRVTVKIYDQEYTVSGEESEEYMKKIAEYVDNEFKRIYGDNRKFSHFMAAIFTAFSIADKYHRTYSELNEIKEQVVEPLKELESIKNQLENANKEIEKIKEERDNYKEQLLKVKTQNEHYKNKEKHLEHALKLKEEELANSQKIINDLQNKLFENQIELIQTKKELDEFLKTFDNEEK